MEHIKLQAGCLVIIMYIAFIYFRECARFHRSLKETLFDEMLVLGMISIILDGATAYTVNDPVLINTTLNTVLHALFLVSLDTEIFFLFLYMLDITGMYPKNKKARFLIKLPFAVNAAAVIFNIGSLEYVQGRVTNYSMGISAYTCFIMAAVYILLSLGIFFKSWSHLESHKRISIFTYLMALALITGIQLIFPETLVSSLAVTVFIVGMYMNLENPALKELSHFHTETVMSFANLIENRDNNTGGHVKRTSDIIHILRRWDFQKKRYMILAWPDYFMIWGSPRCHLRF